MKKIIEMTVTGGGCLPANEEAVELIDNSVEGEVISFIEVTSRDVSFHRAYFSLLHYIWTWLPKKFQEAVPKDKFYQWLKHLKGQYEVLYRFADGTTMVEYESISFGRMSQKTFEAYVKSQLPYIYSEVIMKLYPDKIDSDKIIAMIEYEYEKFLMRL